MTNANSSDNNQRQEIAEQNIGALIQSGYDPQQPSAEFVATARAAMQQASAEQARQRQIQQHYAGAQYRPFLRTLTPILAAAVVALAAGLLLALWAMQKLTVPVVPQQFSTAMRSLDAIAAQAQLLKPSPSSGGLTARPRPAAPEAVRAEVGSTIQTKPGQRQRLTMPEGSILYVNGNTKLTIQAARKIDLARGEVFIEAAPLDSQRGRVSFSVRTPHRTVTALGTKFDVRADGEDTKVFVTQGKVEVSGYGGMLYAGRQLSAGKEGGGEKLGVIPRASAELEWTRDLAAAANSPLVPESEYTGGALIAVDPNGQESRLSLRKVHVDVHIEDGFARTTIDQTYFNHMPSRLEGTFYFPLPPDASISRLAMYVNGQLMEGGMAEREEARFVFEDIMNTRRDPALLEWVDGSTFKMRVFPLEGREEKRIILSYAQRVESLYGKMLYRFPGGHNMPLVKDWSFHARVVGGEKAKWDCPIEGIKRSVSKGDLLLDAQMANVNIGGDVVLALEELDATASAMEYERLSMARHEGYGYLMLRYRPMLSGTGVPPVSGMGVTPMRGTAVSAVQEADAKSTGETPVPRTDKMSATPSQPRPRRDWIFLFESGGDRNPLLARTQIDVVKTLLEQAEHSDRFAILTAGTHVRSFTDTLLPATPDNVQAGLAWLDKTHLIGALDLQGALSAAAQLCREAANAHLVHVGSGIAILGSRKLEELVKLIPQTTTYVGIGVGRRWDRNFMKEAATASGGYFTQINPDEDVTWRAFETASTLNAPRLMNIKVQADTKAEFLSFGDSLETGQELCAVARLGKDEAMPTVLTVSGSLDGQPYSRQVVLANVAGGADYLPRFWAKLQIDRLLTENAEANKNQIVELSKAMYVMSPFTSLLVLENEQMYQQYKVDRGRKDHWAMYAAPAKIDVVREPLANQPVPTTQPSQVQPKPALEQVLSTVLVRVGPRMFYWPNYGYGGGSQTLNAWQWLNGQGVDDDGYYRSSGRPISLVEGRAREKIWRGISNGRPDSAGGGSGVDRAGAWYELLGYPSGSAATRGPRASEMVMPDGRMVSNALMLPMSGPRGGSVAGSTAGPVRFNDALSALRTPMATVNTSTVLQMKLERTSSLARKYVGNVSELKGQLAGRLVDQPIRPVDLAERRLTMFDDQEKSLWAVDGHVGIYTGDWWGIGGDFLSGTQVNFASPYYRQPMLTYQRPQFTNDYRIYYDLVSYAPGMNTTLSDIRAVAEEEAKQDQPIKIGQIDPAAKALIDKARQGAWQIVTIPSRDGDDELTITINGQGQCTWTRLTATGLAERLICDGKNLYQLYEELGLGAVRKVSRFHRADILSAVPWLVPPAEDLAYGADVKLLKDRVVAITPAGAEGAKDELGQPRPYAQLELVFDAAGSLIERRAVEMPSGKLLGRQTYGSDGTVCWIDAAGKELAKIKYTVRNAAEQPELKVDGKKLVILPMPIRTSQHLLQTAIKPFNRGNGPWIESLALLASSLAERNGQDYQVVGERFKKGDRRIGYYTLLLSANGNWDHRGKVNLVTGSAIQMNPKEDFPENPLAEYIVAQIEANRTGQNNSHTPVAKVTDGFIGRLSNFRHLYMELYSGRFNSGTEAERKANRDETIAFIRQVSPSTFGWALLMRMYDQGGGEQFYSAVVDLSKPFEQVDELGYFARYEVAGGLYSAGKQAESLEAFKKLYADALRSGALPLIDGRFRDAFNRDGKFAELMRDTADGLAKQARESLAVYLAWQVQGLGETALAEELLSSTLLSAEKTPRRLATALAAAEFMYRTGNYVRADQIISPLLEDEKLAKEPALWRLGMAVATSRGRLAVALKRQEKALDLEFVNQGQIVNLAGVRQEYSSLLGKYAQLAQAVVTLEAELPAELTGRVIQAADRWRALDPEVGSACQSAAQVLQTLGQRELAWEYLTTPLSAKPNEAAPWVAMAQSLRQSGEAELADRAYESAFAAEGTNAQILWDRAQLLQQTGKHDQARKLYEQIAKGAWPRQFNWIQSQAKRYVGMN